MAIRGHDIRRNADGLFHCDRCDYRNRNPEYLRHHFEACHGNTTNIAQLEGDIGAGTLETLFAEAVDPQLLRRHALAYHPNFGLLECLLCHEPLRQNFRSHMANSHDMVVPADVASIVAGRCFELPCPYLDDTVDEVLPRVPFMECYQGFTCNQCSFMSKTRKGIDIHCRRNDHLGVTPIWLQEFPRGAVKRYVRVEPPTTPGPNTVDNGVLSATLERGRLTTEPVPPIRPDPFLQVQHITDDAEIEACIGLAQYSVIAENDQPKFTALENFCRPVFTNMMSRLKRTEYSLCAVFGADHVLTHPQTDQTVDSYIADWVAFVLFAVNYVVHRMADSNMSEPARRLLLSPVESDLVEFIRQMTFQSVMEGRRRIVFDCFMRSRFFGPDRIFIGADGVSRLANKLIFLQKLVSLIWFTSQAGQEARISAMETVRVNFSTTIANAFSSLSLMLSSARSVSLSEFSAPKIVPHPDDPNDIEVEGVRMTLGTFRQAYARLQCKVSELQSELMMATAPAILAADIDPRLGGSRPNCGLQCRDQSKQDMLGEHLLRVVLQDPQLKDVYVDRVEGNRIRFKYDAVQRYLDLYDQYTQTVLVLLHMGAGMPARGSELATYTIVNDAHHPRVLQFAAGRIMFVCSYNKTNAMRHLNQVIVRSLCWEQSLVVLRDVFVVRPFLCALLAGRSDDIRDIRLARMYRQRMFVWGGKEMTGEHICTTFKSVFGKIARVRLNFRTYRHVVKYFVNLYKIDEGLGIFEWIESNASQFGHTPHVGAHVYGIASDESELVRTRTMTKFLKLSQRWHEFLTVQAQEQVDTETVDLPRPRRQMRPRQPENHLAVVPVGQDPETTVDFVHSASPANNVSPLNLPSRELTVSGPKPAVLPQFVVDFSLQTLRRLLEKPDAKFLSHQQRSGVEAVMFTDLDVVAVFATGGGKSLLFLLYALARPELTSIVIVPTVALRDDLMARARAFGISCESAVSMASLRPVLIFLTPESLSNVAVNWFIASLVTAGRFGRLFVDEAHCILADGDWRPMYRQIATIRQYQAPIVLMSATLPPARTEQLLEAFYVDKKSCAMIRTPSIRPNHQYLVRKYGRYEDIIRDLVLEIDMAPRGSRFIVYWRIIRDVDKFHGLLHNRVRAFKYHSKHDQSQEHAALWRNTDKAVMVATSGFGAGIDFPAVRAVYCGDIPYSLCDLVQEFGRAGRDGLSSSCVIYCNNAKENSEWYRTNPVKRSDFDLAVGFTSPGICRRRYLSQYLDGTQVGCEFDISYSKCDTCQDPTPMMPASFFTNARDRLPPTVAAVAQADLVELEQFSWDLRAALDSMRGLCIFCSLQHGTRIRKGSQICQTGDCRNRCLRCFSMGHEVIRCPIPAIDRDERATAHCCWCLMPLAVMATRLHQGAVDGNCDLRDIIRDTVMVSRELELPVTASYEPSTLYQMINSQATTMGVHTWLHGHFWFMAIYNHILSPQRPL